jgi:hypothetical protein
MVEFSPPRKELLPSYSYGTGKGTSQCRLGLHVEHSFHHRIPSALIDASSPTR